MQLCQLCVKLYLHSGLLLQVLLLLLLHQQLLI
jgi:hypothetical protein